LHYNCPYSSPAYPVLYSPSQHSAKHFFAEIWDTLKNLTTFYLIIYVIGIQGFTNFTSNANIQLQYYVIKLTNFQAGIDTITTYSALVLAIYLFQRYMINRDWHITQYASVLIAAGLGLVWIAPYYNSGGTQDPWFTIFIDLDTVRQSSTFRGPE
jgi:presenilin-like A22 family membrane protease